MNLTPMRFQGKSIAKSHKFACRWRAKQTVLYSKIDCFTMKNRLFCSREGLFFYHKHHAILLQPCQDGRWVASLFCACVNSRNVAYSNGKVMRSEQISLQA